MSTCLCAAWDTELSDNLPVTVIVKNEPSQPVWGYLCQPAKMMQNICPEIQSNLCKNSFRFKAEHHLGATCVLQNKEGN